MSAFTVTVDGTAVAPETSNPVRISGRELKLVLADTLAPGAGPVKVSYAATGGLLSARGGTAPGFTDQTVINITPGNATGPLKVKGTRTRNHALHVHTREIGDPQGLPGGKAATLCHDPDAKCTYQWIDRSGHDIPAPPGTATPPSRRMSAAGSRCACPSTTPTATARP